METTQEQPKKRIGNPNFYNKRKVETPETTEEETLNKQYYFQLVKTHEKQKPISAKLGELGGVIFSPYQPFYGVVNSGLAWDPEFTPKNATKKGGSRRWRYLHGFPSVWIDEQIDPEPTQEDLANNLNDLTFRNGLLRVSGYEKTKLQALMLNDAYDKCVRPLKNIPKQYTLINQEEIDKSVLDKLDDAFEAEKTAREATLEEMYACAYYFGINLAQSDTAIRKEFISTARNKPDVFNKQFANPKNKYKFIFKQALDNNIISDTLVPGTVYLVDAHKKVYDTKTGETAEELAVAVLSSDKDATELYNELKRALEL